MFSILSIRPAIAVLAGSVALLAPAMANADAGMAPPPSSTKLTLINGWTTTSFNTAKPSVSVSKGIVHLQGAISTSGTNTEPFVLPAAFRPSALIYVPVDMCGATNGRLVIDTSGNVNVEAETNFDNAQCFTSLDGVAFAVSADGAKSLKLKHGWSEYGGSTAAAAVRKADGTVYFSGAIATTKKNVIPFTLPASLRPTSIVYTKVDLCGASNGRLQIDPDGTVFVQAEGSFSDAQCFTSLDGVSFAADNSGYTPLTLINGWADYGFGTANAAVTVSKGLVKFQGAIATSGASAVPFFLPTAFRPKNVVYVPVDMCSATNGRLIIGTDGSVTVQAETDFGNAQCFTSLEGVSFRQ